MGKSVAQILILCQAILLSGCSEEGSSAGEYVYRRSGEYLYTTPQPRWRPQPSYPWREERYGKITKEFFRCHGSELHPVVKLERQGKESLYFRDCAGGSRHGLPMREGKEFIYPCLLRILNYVQEKTGLNVVITTGHRCPEHNLYCDLSPTNRASKHMLGAEVDFYVEGMEHSPEKVIALIEEFYQNDEEYTTFSRYQKQGLNVSTPPWMNKEIFIKLYLPSEGRDFDNRHPYPYLGIQVRYDRETGKPVAFSDSQAQNYLR